MCPSTNYTLRAVGPTGTTFSNWKFFGGFSYASGSGNIAYVTTSSNYGNGRVEVDATNSCGTTTLMIGRSVSKYSFCGYSMMIAPNPSTDYTEISLVSGDSNDNIDQPLPEDYQLDIYNKSGNKVKSIKSRSKKNRIDIRNLPADIYFLRLTYQEDVLEDKIIITK